MVRSNRIPFVLICSAFINRIIYLLRDCYNTRLDSPCKKFLRILDCLRTWRFSVYLGDEWLSRERLGTDSLFRLFIVFL